MQFSHTVGVSMVRTKALSQFLEWLAPSKQGGDTSSSKKTQRWVPLGLKQRTLLTSDRLYLFRPHVFPPLFDPTNSFQPQSKASAQLYAPLAYSIPLLHPDTAACVEKQSFQWGPWAVTIELQDAVDDERSTTEQITVEDIASGKLVYTLDKPTSPLFVHFRHPKVQSVRGRFGVTPISLAFDDESTLLFVRYVRPRRCAESTISCAVQCHCH